jgi:hypothetical protein
MPLASGTKTQKLGPYEIVGPLGAGLRVTTCVPRFTVPFLKPAVSSLVALPDIKSELARLDELLHHPAQGIQPGIPLP